MNARVGVAIGGAVAALLLVIALASGGAAAPAPTPDGGLSQKVKIIIQVNPPEKAAIMWGKKSIGVANLRPKKPFILERPRDSGPMDIVIRAKGFLPVHTRAYTFADSKLFVKLTPEEEKKTVFGYREELPDAGPPDGGAPSAVVGPPAPVGPPGPDAGAR
jgi:hypothetical protein